MSPSDRLPLVMTMVTAKFRSVPSVTEESSIVSVPFRSVIVPVPWLAAVTAPVSVPVSVTVTLSEFGSTIASSTTGRSIVTDCVPSPGMSTKKSPSLSPPL